jgi:hypothetical protein
LVSERGGGFYKSRQGRRAESPRKPDEKADAGAVVSITAG